MSRPQQVGLGLFLLTMAVALLSPLEGAGHRELTAHMVQHVLLLSVASPALALALPGGAGPWPAARWYWAAAAAVTVQTIVVLTWHVPWAFDAALRTNAVHALEHLTMLGSATALWRVLLRRPLRGEGVIALFLSTLPLTVLGVGLLLSTTPWYERYRDVADQQVAGAVMWGVGGGLAVAQGVALFAAWVASADRAAASPGTRSSSSRV